ncbi:MAG: M24 family metallopeptidase C-terminal domain-containing protein, partial [Paracoccus sp. (in: a-proteobacteria)]|nr:M24 family metallopeptidase C-terminal domain-containing protein [Paracoccus sp. (in: a-proteobacteria)]
GYYREGAFGIRIENLLVVTPAESPDGRDLLGFETLSFAPIDRRLILRDMLSGPERDWLDAYHADVLARIGPLVDASVRDWLARACAPI